MNNAVAEKKKAPVNTVRRAAPKKKRRGASLEQRKARSGWLFVLPFVIGLVIIYFPVIVKSMQYSSTETYYLIIQEESGLIAPQRIEFQIDIAFAVEGNNFFD